MADTFSSHVASADASQLRHLSDSARGQRTGGSDLFQRDNSPVTSWPSSHPGITRKPLDVGRVLDEFVRDADQDRRGPCKPEVRIFDTGATRDQDQDKFDPEGFLSPYALHAFQAYMHEHRKQSDGSLRDSDNWQKGIPLDAYMKSMYRHFMDVWHNHRKTGLAREDIKTALCALLFNVQGMLHEVTKHDAQEEDKGSEPARTIKECIRNQT